MTDEDFEEFDADAIPPEELKLIKSVTKTTHKLNDILKEETVSVGLSALTSAFLQMICLTSDSKEEAQKMVEHFGGYVMHALDDADSNGICNWNATRQ